MSKPQNRIFNDFPHYVAVAASQMTTNPEYLYVWTTCTLVQIGVTGSPDFYLWAFFGFLNLLVGIFAIGSSVKRVDRAFETIGLDFSKGYGRPTWIVKGKYPLKNELLQIRSAGYSEDDYASKRKIIASRLNQPIREIRKPSAELPVIHVAIKRSEIPSKLEFASLPFSELKSGEFFIGQSDDGFLKLSLSQMIHMLVAGQTGSGKTQFLRQFIATLLTRTPNAHVALIDMKGGIDFQQFRELPNFEIAKDYVESDLMLSRLISLFELRKKYLLEKKKNNWSELNQANLVKEAAFLGKPVGPVIAIVDELAELSLKATERASKSELQEKLASLARLARFTGIHLVLGTQRPDKSVINMQSKDNLPTRLCFSVPSVQASTLVVGDMTASTLGGRPGRAVYVTNGMQIVQTPYLSNSELENVTATALRKLTEKKYDRKISNEANRSGLTQVKGGGTWKTS